MFPWMSECLGIEDTQIKRKVGNSFVRCSIATAAAAAAASIAAAGAKMKTQEIDSGKASEKDGAGGEMNAHNELSQSDENHSLPGAPRRS